MSNLQKLVLAWMVVCLPSQIGCAQRPFEMHLSTASNIEALGPEPEEHTVNPVVPESLKLTLQSEPGSTITPEFKVQGLGAGDKALLLRGSDAECVGGTLVGERVAKASALTPIIKSLNPGASETTADFRAKIIRADGTLECTEAVSVSLPAGTLPANAPYYIQSLPPVHQLATWGGATTCGLTPQGTVWCWGVNPFGQLGNGQVGGTISRSLATQVVGLADVVQIAAASLTAFMALTQSGDLYWWGKMNQSLTSPQSSVPVLLGHFPSVIQLDKSFVLSGDGNLTRFGSFYCGEGCLDQVVATQVLWFTAMLGDSFCTYNQDHSTSCYAYWGAPGELAQWSLERVAGLQNSLEIAPSQGFQCALTLGAASQRQVSCWTNFPEAQAEGYWAPTYSLTPEIVPISGVRNLFADYYSLMWITNEGSIYRWGDDGADPQVKADVHQVVTLASGPTMFRGCALQEAGTVMCWMNY